MRTGVSGNPLWRLYPLVFLILSLAGGLFITWNNPPFMAPDEMAHMQRADLTTFGKLTAHRTAAGYTGAEVDLAIEEASRPFDDIRAQPQNRADYPDYIAAGAYRFDGRTGISSMLGTGATAPILYLPATVAVAIGKARQWPVVTTMYAARGATAIFCALVGMLALSLAQRARAPMFTILLLPMAMALFGAVSPDGPLIVTAALGVALISRAMSASRPMTTAELAGAVICFTLIGLTKTPYALFGLVFLFAPVARPRQRWIAAAVTLAIPLLWQAWATATIQTPLSRPGAVLDSAAQARFLLGHLDLIPAIATETMRIFAKTLVREFIGVLGWLDTPLSDGFYIAAYSALALAFVTGASFGVPTGWGKALLSLPVIILATLGAVFAALYLAWTPVGGMAVIGVQGRYFLPVALLASLFAEGRRPLLGDGAGARIETALTALVLAFPLVSLLVIQRAVVLRYYLD